MPDASASVADSLGANGSGKSQRSNSRPGSSRKKRSYSPDVHRRLPCSLDAEKGLLGSALLLPEKVIDECIQHKIGPEHFHLPAHGIIFGAIREMRERGLPVDLISVTQFLEDRHKLEEAGGAAMLAELYDFVPTGANSDYYLQIVRDKYLLRRIITTCNEFAARAYDEQDHVHELLDEVESGILRVGDERELHLGRNMHDLTMEAIAHIEKIFSKKGEISGLTTGFPMLDRMTDGFKAGEMIIVAARPSVGKTALAMNIAEHVAIKEHKKVAIYSLEMATQQLVQRLLCSMAKVNLRKLNEGQRYGNNKEMDQIVKAAEELSRAKMFIDDTPALTILELRARCRRLHQREGGLDLVIIDYLQLLRGSSAAASEHREREVAEISSGIKSLAKELKVPILSLAQLNRDPEKRTTSGKSKPRLSDIRESGSVEQDADVVALLWREDYQSHDADDKKDAEEIAGKTELIIAKQRNGPTGEIPLVFLKEFTRFEERSSRTES